MTKMDKNKEQQLQGFARIAVHPSGEKARLVDYQANSLSLQDHFSGFVDEDADSLIDMNEVDKICPNNNNCLLLVTFTYESVSSFNGEFTEWENVTHVKDVIILNTDYKEIWRDNLQYMYGCSELSELSENLNVEDISEWEEFYDEEISFKEQKHQINALEKLFL